MGDRNARYARQPHREQRLARVKLVLLEAGDRWLSVREVAAKVKPAAGASAHVEAVRFDLELLRSEKAAKCRHRTQRSYEWHLA